MQHAWCAQATELRPGGGGQEGRRGGKGREVTGGTGSLGPGKVCGFYSE